MNREEKIRLLRYYDGRARSYHDLDAYGTLLAFTRAQGLRDHLRLVEEVEPSSILDVGCGTGRFLLEFAKRYDRVLGLDLSSRMLTILRDRLRDLGLRSILIRADSENLPLRDSSIDLVHSAGLTAVFRSERMIEEMIRVARRCVIVSFPARESLNGLFVSAMMRLGWNPSILDYWYGKREIEELFSRFDGELEVHRVGWELPIPHKLSKKIKLPSLIRILEKLDNSSLRDALNRLLGARYVVRFWKD